MTTSRTGLLAATGFGLVVFALVGYLAGAAGLAAPALAAAFLTAAFGFCLGCELYLLLRQLRRRTS